MKEYLLLLALTVVSAEPETEGLVPRRDSPNHLQYLSLEDRTGTAEFFYSNS
jgi:hypothetical protein